MLNGVGSSGGDEEEEEEARRYQLALPPWDCPALSAAEKGASSNNRFEFEWPF
jgi:hypothetical protein